MTATRSVSSDRTSSGSAAAAPANRARAGRGFTPAARRRNRIALGVVLAAIAIGGNALVYASLDSKDPAVQVVVDVPAGGQITPDMLRTVEVDADSTVNLVDGDDLDSLVGRYAKVRLVSGSLVTTESFQSQPLVAEGNAVVAIQVPDGSLPIGLRERVPVLLVIASDRSDDSAAPISVTGRVVGLPTTTNSALGVESLSVEVAAADAPTIAAADDVRVVLIEPSEDPATDVGAPVDGIEVEDGAGAGDGDENGVEDEDGDS